jgi:hypothetical protein
MVVCMRMPIVSSRALSGTHFPGQYGLKLYNEESVRIFFCDDLVLNTAGAVRIGVPSMAGQLGAGYAILIPYVPALFLTHLLALWLLLRPARVPVQPASAPLSLAATEWPGKGCIRWVCCRWGRSFHNGRVRWHPVNRDAGWNWKVLSKPQVGGASGDQPRNRAIYLRRAILS